MEFVKASVFQGGIVNFLVNMKSTNQDTEELKKLFMQLDTSKDGQLSRDEIEAGINQMFGRFGHISVDDYEGII